MIRAFRLHDERVEGREEGQSKVILKLLNKYKDTAKVADMLDMSVEEVRRIAEEYHLPEQA